MLFIKGNTKVKKKVGFISHASDLYGAPKALLLLLSKMKFEKYDPFVICPKNGPLVDQLRKLQIPTYVFSKNCSYSNNVKENMFEIIVIGLKKIIYILKLLFFLNTKKPRLLYINTISHVEPIIVAKILHIPMIVHVRETDIYLKSYGSIRKKFRISAILNFPNRFICVSKATAQLLFERNVPSKKVTVIYDGINLEEFKFSEEIRQEKRKELGVDSKNILIGFVGQLIERKGIEDFIEAIHIVHIKNKNCKFIVVGGPVDSLFFKSKILPLYNAYKLKDCIIFTGFRKDIVSYFSAIDIFVNTSKKEPFAMVNLEAMSMERPIIATNAGGNPEAIIDGETGYIVPVGNSQSLAEKILELAEKAKIRNNFGKAARQRMEKYFTLDHYCKDVESLINYML